MQKAIRYRKWVPSSTENQIPSPLSSDNPSESIETTTASERVKNLVSENAVLVLGRRGCCMCHVVKRLLLSLGVNPVVYELDEEDEEVGAVIEEMEGLSGDRRLQFPAVFIGGSLIGGLDRLMAVHISGDLVPILKKAGALWL